MSGEGSCPVGAGETAFLKMPSDCPGEPPSLRGPADSSKEPFPEFEEREARYESADLAGDLVSVRLGELKFEPTITARPRPTSPTPPRALTSPAPAPRHQPGLASTAALRDAVIRFPAGLAVNPFQAAGLGALLRG